MPFRKRRRNNEPQKPASVFSYVTGSAGVIALLLCALMIYSAAQSNGNTPSAFALIGVLCILGTLICTIFGIRLFRDDTHSFESRILGLMAPLIAFVVWMAVYIYGMMAG